MTLPRPDWPMDPLPQYGSYALIPYLSSDTSGLESKSPASTASSPTTSTDGSIDDIPLRDLFPPLTLLNTSSWMYCGPILSPVASSLPPSFHTWMHNTISGPLLPRLLPFLDFLRGFLERAGAQHYWLTIRATRPTTEYDIVRWHTDDIFFDYEGETERLGPKDKRRKEKRKGYWKLATTLLGPPTLFLKDGIRGRRIQRAAKRAECQKRGEHTCTQFRCLGCLDAVEAVRQSLAKSLANEAVESPESGEVAFFRLGDEEGAVHSEPPCHEDRIFVNVVPGTEEELKELMDRWGLGYPRAWSFGIPVSFDTNVTSPFSAETASNPMEEDEKSSFPSSMSVNLEEEYTEWLKRKGFRSSYVFGQKTLKKRV